MENIQNLLAGKLSPRLKEETRSLIFVPFAIFLGFVALAALLSGNTIATYAQVINGTLSADLEIETEDSAGNSIDGLFVVVSQGGSTVDDGFSPVSFSLDIGETYNVEVSDFGNFTFDHWDDNDSTSSERSVLLLSDTELVAVYNGGEEGDDRGDSDDNNGDGSGDGVSQPTNGTGRNRNLDIERPGLFSPDETSDGCLEYDRESKMLEVSCDSNIMDLFFGIRDDEIMRSLGSGEILLTTNVTVNDGATLYLDSESGINYIKISDNNGITVNGRIDINDTKITSWNATAGEVIGLDDDYSGAIPRAYMILSESEGGRIVNSELGYLGFNETDFRGFELVDGTNSLEIHNSTFHNMWYGLYSSDAYNITISDSEFRDSIRYAMDYHDSVRDISVTNNHVHGNSIALVCGIDCQNAVFSENEIHDNDRSAILLSRNTSNATVYNNTIYNQPTGISVSESDGNEIFGNTISADRVGIHLSNPDAPDEGNSTDNNVYDNIIEDAGYGIVAERTSGNILSNNTFAEIETAHFFLESGASVVIRNQNFSNTLVEGEFEDAETAENNTATNDKENTLIIEDSGRIRISPNVTHDTDESRYVETVVPHRLIVVNSVD